MANALADLGVRKYDRVAILAHNTIDHVLTWIGCAKIGAVYLAINYLLRGKDISYCINHSESKVFIVEDALFDLVKDVLDDMPTVKTLIWSRAGSGPDPGRQTVSSISKPGTEIPGHGTGHDPPYRGALPDDLHERHGISPQGGHHQQPGPHGPVHGLHRRRPVRRGRHQRQRPAHLPLRPAGRVHEPHLLGGRHQYPHDARHRADPEEHGRLQGHDVLRAAHGLDRHAPSSGFDEVRSVAA